MKRVAPTISARIEAIRTAAAATSFATLALACRSGLIILTIASRLVLISSRMRTKLIVEIRISHSLGVKLSIMATTIANVPTRR